MKSNRGWSVLLCLLAGCSTHPCADISDFFHPGKMYPNEVNPPYGGVWVQQHTIMPLTPTLPAIVPPPMPMPAGTPSFQLQPPMPPTPPKGFGN
jgi:hypothetical protein